MRSFRKIRISVALAVVLTAVFAPSCDKVDTDLRYEVVGYIQLPEVDTLIPYSPWILVYYHYADTADWTVGSYEDAAQGIITHKNSREIRHPDGAGVWMGGDSIVGAFVVNDKVYGGGYVSTGPFTEGPVMLVAYDSVRHTEKYMSKMYAWRQVDIQAGISRVRVPVTFAPEKSGSWRDTLPDGTVTREVHVASKWFVANDNPYSIYRLEGDEDGDEDEDGDDGSGG